MLRFLSTISIASLAVADDHAQSSSVAQYPMRWTQYDGTSNMAPEGIEFLEVGDEGVVFPMFDRADHLEEGTPHDLTVQFFYEHANSNDDSAPFFRIDNGVACFSTVSDQVTLDCFSA